MKLLQLQSFFLQQEPLAAAQELCERLLVRAETLRLGVCQAGVQYRHFFAWLLRTVRRLNDDNPAAAAEAAAIKVNPSDVAVFLHGQFSTDMIGPELKVRLKPTRNKPLLTPVCSFVLNIRRCGLLLGCNDGAC